MSKEAYKIGSVNTVKNYVQYLENTFLLFEIQRFSYKLKEQVLAPRKIYCVDTGIIHAIGFRSSENIGKLMENIVALEFKRRAAVRPSMEIYYWKDHQQREVDFVVKEGNLIKACVQVTYATEKDDIQNREIRSLFKASEELNCKNLLVITWDYEGIVEGIRYVPIWKWLLNPTDLEAFAL